MAILTLKARCGAGWKQLVAPDVPPGSTFASLQSPGLRGEMPRGLLLQLWLLPFFLHAYC